MIRTSSAFWVILKRDLLLALRRRSEIFTVLFFFVVVISLFPLGVGTEDEMLKQIAPGVVWIAALLASTLALDRLFASDYEDGTLEKIVLAPSSLSVSVFAKILAHWLLTGLPLVLISPLVGLFYHLPMNSIWVMMSGARREVTIRQTSLASSAWRGIQRKRSKRAMPRGGASRPFEATTTGSRRMAPRPFRPQKPDLVARLWSQ